MASVPLAVAVAQELPKGFFYLFAGPPGGQWGSVFEVGNGRESLVTRGDAGRQVDLFGASPSGVVVSDNAGITAGLARWTKAGPRWLHPRGSAESIAGQLPAISSAGKITYMLPPQGSSGEATVWARRSWSSPDRVILRTRDYPVASAFGPHALLALADVGQAVPASKPDVTILDRGHVKARLRSGIARLGLPVCWGPRAPALAVNELHGEAELLFLDGKRELLPAGWKALAWAPGGRRLLMERAGELGLWTTTSPHLVKAIGEINPGFRIWQAYWLSSAARM